MSLVTLNATLICCCFSSSADSLLWIANMCVYLMIPVSPFRRLNLSLSPSDRRSASLTRSSCEPTALIQRTWARKSTVTSSTRRRCTMMTSFTSPTLKTAKRLVKPSRRIRFSYVCWCWVSIQVLPCDTVALMLQDRCTNTRVHSSCNLFHRLTCRWYRKIYSEHVKSNPFFIIIIAVTLPT